MTDVPTAARIAEVAHKILAEEGAAAINMRRVAAAAGITPMAIYRYFANREALLQSVADTALTEIAARWSAKAAGEGPMERMWAQLEDYLDFALDEPGLYDFIFRQRRVGARRFPEDFTEGRSPTFNVLAGGVAEAMDQGLLRRDDVWEVALTISAQVDGLIQSYHASRISLSEKDFRALCRRNLGRLIDGLKG